MLAVVALDGADYRLCREWGCENILLENHRSLESFAHSQNFPSTLEVWTSVATGLHPKEHGIESTGEAQEWESPLLSALGSIARHVVPIGLRVKIGTFLRGDRGGDRMSFPQTEADHPFDEGAVYGWPGITAATHLSETWHWMQLASEGTITEGEFWKRIWCNAGQEVGFVLGASQSPHPVVGVHMHVLDAAGHTFAEREERLRAVYRTVDDLLGVLRRQVDDLLIVSDHGMQVDWIEGDADPGTHSWRAVAATTLDVEPPADVFEVREWIETHAGETQSQRTAVMDTTRNQLEELGYL